MPVLTRTGSRKRELACDIKSNISSDSEAASCVNSCKKISFDSFSASEGLFSSDFLSDSGNLTPPKTPTKIKKTQRIKPAQYCATSKSTSPLLGRESETAFISSFLAQNISDIRKRFPELHIRKKINDENSPPIRSSSPVSLDIRSSSLYISGSPGCGKTAVVSNVLDSLNLPIRNYIFLNCLALASPNSVFSAIQSHLVPGSTPSDSRSLSRIKKILLSQKKFTILVLDEVDNLFSRHQHLLYSVFDLSKIPNVVVIAIANSIDLTENLPRLQQRGCMPEILDFMPYSHQTINSILENLFPSFSKAALSLISKKSEAIDLRWCISVCQKAAIFSTNEIIDVPQVLKSFNSNKNHVRHIMSLALPSKIALVALIPKSLPKSSNASTNSLTVATWHSNFAELCENPILALPTLPETDFQDLATSLESSGLVRLKSAPVKNRLGSGVSRTSTKSAAESGRNSLVELSIPISDILRGVTGGDFAQSGSAGQILSQLIEDVGLSEK